MLEDYFLPTGDFNAEALLSDWRWLIGNQPVSIHAIAAIGSLFLKDESGRIYHLQINDGTFDCISESVAQFEMQLGDRHNRRDWLQGFLVRELRNRGVLLGPGQCYGTKIPYHLGGKAGIENIEPTDLTVHVSILGQLHRQTQAMPPGTAIHEIRVE